MKCVKFYRPYGGHVIRLTNEEAAAAIDDGRAMYAPKHWLRAAKALEREENRP